MGTPARTSPMREVRFRLRLALIAAVGLAGLALTGAARAALSEAEVAARIAETYGVRVLKVRPAAVDGRPVFLVTVMKPGGDRNDAFQVSTLAVDRATGALLPSFRHRTSGAELPPAPAYVPNRQPNDALERGNTWR